MRERFYRVGYVAYTIFYGLLAVLFVGVLITSFTKNAVYMCQHVGLFSWRVPGNYLGLFAGFIAYILFAVSLKVFGLGHNLNWFRRFTHELTHTLLALLFFRKIYEFVVRGRECMVHYSNRRIGYVAITLAPYCIPIYTFMLFPFRFAGDSHYMIVFDALIAFTYAFHAHAYIEQTRLTQPDIVNCGVARSVAYISFTHLAVLSLIIAIPKGGVLNAITRVFSEYLLQIITDPMGWISEILSFF